jgi:hypothetical protein
MSYTKAMTGPHPDNTTIITQLVNLEELIELRTGTSTPLQNPVWVSEMANLQPGVPVTSHLLLNIQGGESDAGPYTELAFPPGVPTRRVAPDEMFIVHTIRAGRDLLEGVDPRPPMPPTRGRR